MSPTPPRPVKVGESFVSLRNGRKVKVLEVKLFADPTAWYARVGDQSWLSCSKDGIKGYRKL